MSHPCLLVLNQDLIPFRVHVVRHGDKCGNGGRLTHDEVEPLVEFHEATSLDSAATTQFAAHYRVNTLLSVTGGLALSFHEPRWHLDAAAMAMVLRWLASQGFESRRLERSSPVALGQLKKA